MKQALSILLYVLSVFFAVLAFFNAAELVTNLIPWIASGDIASLLIRTLATLITAYLTYRCWLGAHSQWRASL